MVNFNRIEILEGKIHGQAAVTSFLKENEEILKRVEALVNYKMNTD